MSSFDRVNVAVITVVSAVATLLFFLVGVTAWTDKADDVRIEKAKACSHAEPTQVALCVKGID